MPDVLMENEIQIILKSLASIAITLNGKSAVKGMKDELVGIAEDKFNDFLENIPNDQAIEEGCSFLLEDSKVRLQKINPITLTKVLILNKGFF